MTFLAALHAAFRAWIDNMAGAEVAPILERFHATAKEINK